MNLPAMPRHEQTAPPTTRRPGHKHLQLKTPAVPDECHTNSDLWTHTTQSTTRQPPTEKYKANLPVLLLVHRPAQTRSLQRGKVLSDSKHELRPSAADQPQSLEIEIVQFQRFSHAQLRNESMPAEVASVSDALL